MNRKTLGSISFYILLLAAINVLADRAPSHFLNSMVYEYGATIRSVLETTDGGFVICGDYFDDNVDNMMITKYTADGTVLWTSDTYTEENSSGEDLIETSDGNIVVVGEWEDYYGNESYATLVKFHSSGPAIWGRQIG